MPFCYKWDWWLSRCDITLIPDIEEIKLCQIDISICLKITELHLLLYILTVIYNHCGSLTNKPRMLTVKSASALFTFEKSNIIFLPDYIPFLFNWRKCQENSGKYVFHKLLQSKAVYTSNSVLRGRTETRTQFSDRD